VSARRKSASRYVPSLITNPERALRLQFLILVLGLASMNAEETSAQWDPAILEPNDWITSIVETNSGHLFVATLLGEAWIYNSVSDSWAEFDGVDGSSVWDFYSHPSGHVILDDGDDLLVSEDGGASWEFLAPFGEINGFSAVGDNWIVSKGDGGAVYRSIDAGDHWYLANGTMLPIGWDDHSSDPIYNGQTILYRYTEDLFDGYILRQTESFLPFGSPSGIIENAMSFSRNDDGLTYAVSGSIPVHGTSLISSQNLIDWSGVSTIPVFGVSQLEVRGRSFVAASLVEVVINDEAGEPGDWVSWPIPTGSSIVTSMLIGSDDYLYLGTDCCLFRSSSPIGSSSTPMEQPAETTLELGLVFPNPSKENAQIPIRSSIPRFIEVQMADLSGHHQVLFQKEHFVGHELIDIPQGLAAGVYLIRIVIDNRTVTKKFVVTN